MKKLYRLGAIDPNLAPVEKFAINSVLSATNSSKMDQQDQSDIIAKVKSSSTSDSKDDDGTNDGTDDGTDDGANDVADDTEEGGMDLSGIDMGESVVAKEPASKEFVGQKVSVDFRKEIGIIKDYNDEEVIIHFPDLGFTEKVNYKLVEVKFVEGQFTEAFNPNSNGKTVFQNASLGVDDGGMEENKYLNLENIEKKSNIVGKINIKEMVKESLNSVEPQTAPKVDPTVMPERKTRRSKPYRIIPEQIPDPKPKAEKKSGDIEFVKDSGFSEDGNSVTIKFDVYGEPDRFVSNFLNTGEITNLNSGDEDSRYIYQTDILSNGKQYYVLVSKFDGAIDMNTKGYTTEAQFTDGEIPVIEEV